MDTLQLQGPAGVGWAPSVQNRYQHRPAECSLWGRSPFRAILVFSSNEHIGQRDTHRKDRMWQHYHKVRISNTALEPGNRAVPGGDEINKQKPSRSGPSKVEVSGNSMCVVSRKPSVRLLLALAPHLAQPSALPPPSAPRLARSSTALLPGVRPPSLNSPWQWKGLEFKTR